jgi:hypothetical protein
VSSILSALVIVTFAGLGALWSGCIYFSAKNRKAQGYFEIKNLAKTGNGVAKVILFIFYLGIASAVTFSVVGMYAQYSKASSKSSHNKLLDTGADMRRSA